MTYDIFKALNQKHRVLGWHYFRQKTFRRKHTDLEDRGYCCALVHLWWLCLSRQEDLFSLLEHPTPTLLDYLTIQQVRSAYVPSLHPFLDRSLSQADKHLLQLKYGTYDITALRDLLTQYQTDSLLDVDIALHYGCEILHKDVWHTYTEDIPHQLGRPYGSEHQLKVLVVRYPSGEGVSSSEKGHRMGLYISQTAPHTFFDPNHGQVLCTSASSFTEWFWDFWEHAPYQTYLDRVSSKRPSLILYHLTPLPNPVERADNQHGRKPVRAIHKEVETP